MNDMNDDRAIEALDNVRAVRGTHESEGGRSRESTLIEPQTDSYFPDVRELWEFRNLLRTLMWRNFRVRYRNAALGVMWVVLQPLILMLVFVQVFNVWARIDVQEIPYSVHAISGLVLLFFANRMVSESINLVRSNQSLTRKVYFPKMLLPCALVGSELMDLAVGLVLMFVIMLLYGFFGDGPIYPEPTTPLALFFLLLLVGWGFALSTCLAALGIRYHDLILIIPIVMLLQMYLAPVIYPITAVDPERMIYYALNPMVGIVNGFRWAVLGIGGEYLWTTWISIVEIFLLGLFGVVYFSRTERSFNDFL